ATTSSDPGGVNAPGDDSELIPAGRGKGAARAAFFALSIAPPAPGRARVGDLHTSRRPARCRPGDRDAASTATCADIMPPATNMSAIEPADPRRALIRSREAVMKGAQLLKVFTGQPGDDVAARAAEIDAEKTKAADGNGDRQLIHGHDRAQAD